MNLEADGVVGLVDSYRNKIRETMEKTDMVVAATAPHFELRVGKRRWNERGKRERKSVGVDA